MIRKSLSCIINSGAPRAPASAENMVTHQCEKSSLPRKRGGGGGGGGGLVPLLPLKICLCSLVPEIISKLVLSLLMPKMFYVPCSPVQISHVLLFPKIPGRASTMPHIARPIYI